MPSLIIKNVTLVICYAIDLPKIQKSIKTKSGPCNSCSIMASVNNSIFRINFMIFFQHGPPLPSMAPSLNCVHRRCLNYANYIKKHERIL